MNTKMTSASQRLNFGKIPINAARVQKVPMKKEAKASLQQIWQIRLSILNVTVSPNKLVLKKRKLYDVL